MIVLHPFIKIFITKRDRMACETDLCDHRPRIKNERNKKSDIASQDGKIKKQDKQITAKRYADGYPAFVFKSQKSFFKEILHLFSRFFLLINGIAIAFIFALTAQNLVGRHAENIRKHGNECEIGRTFIPLPTADRFIRHAQLFGKLSLRHAVCFSEGGDKTADRFLFHIIFSFLFGEMLFEKSTSPCPSAKTFLCVITRNIAEV